MRRFYCLLALLPLVFSCGATDELFGSSNDAAAMTTNFFRRTTMMMMTVGPISMIDTIAAPSPSWFLPIGVKDGQRFTFNRWMIEPHRM